MLSDAQIYARAYYTQLVAVFTGTGSITLGYFCNLKDKHLTKFHQFFLIRVSASSKGRVLPVQINAVKVIKAEEYNGFCNEGVHRFLGSDNICPSLAVHHPASH